MDIKEATILGCKAMAHWYYVSKGRALIDMLKSIKVPEILDIGAGSGIFSKIIIEAKICESAICVDPAYPMERVELYMGRPIHFVRSVDKVSQSLILMMDVLEHVDDDVGLIRKYTQAMSSGGKVLMTVPAFSSLWSGHDVFLEHRRRYSMPEIENKLRISGLSILRSRFFFGTLFPLVALLRLNNRRRLQSGVCQGESMLKRYPPILNQLLTYVHDIERHVFFPYNRFAGLTIFCLAEKR